MFDPVGHGLLCKPAVALEAENLVAQARLAEHLLGVVSGDYDTLEEGSLERVAWAQTVILQINFFLEKNEALVHEGLGDMQRTYRRDELISPTARLLRDRFLSEIADRGSVVVSAIEEEE